MRVKSTVAVVALALLTAMQASCAPATPPDSPPDNTAAICRQVSERTQPDPEVSRKLAAAYTSGDPASREEARTAQVAMYRSWGTAVQPLADQATSAELKTFLQDFAASLKDGQLNNDHVIKLSKFCLTASPAAVPS